MCFSLMIVKESCFRTRTLGRGSIAIINQAKTYTTLQALATRKKSNKYPVNLISHSRLL
jgi:hypothetical protein